jgi:hypothetical protein
MDPLEADALINDVLYGIDKVSDLTDPVTQERFVRFMIDRRYFSATVAEYAEAIKEIVRRGQVPDTLVDPSRRFTGAEQIEFLRALDGRLDESKPWPRPAFVKVRIGDWDALRDMRVVATVDVPVQDIEGILGRSVDRVRVDDKEFAVLMLELRNGEVVALAGFDSLRSQSFSLLRRGDGDPATLIAHFCEVTGLRPDEVQPV